ncbi:MAG: hypothetical protein O2966_02855 [Proteobacteria bacterium]|nr:hypothetical protein [Pseudomonadota bacterium]
MTSKKIISADEIKALEESKNAALERVAKRLKEQKYSNLANASHSSHSSGSAGGKARTHSSYVTS